MSSSSSSNDKPISYQNQSGDSSKLHFRSTPLPINSIKKKNLASTRPPSPAFKNPQPHHKTKAPHKEENIPSFRQEPALGSSSIQSSVRTPILSYSSAASSAKGTAFNTPTISSSSNTTSPSSIMPTSSSQTASILSLDSLPQRTQSAPPEIEGQPFHFGTQTTSTPQKLTPSLPASSSPVSIRTPEKPLPKIDESPAIPRRTSVVEQPGIPVNQSPSYHAYHHLPPSMMAYPPAGMVYPGYAYQPPYMYTSQGHTRFPGHSQYFTSHTHGISHSPATNPKNIFVPPPKEKKILAIVDPSTKETTNYEYIKSVVTVEKHEHDLAPESQSSSVSKDKIGTELTAEPSKEALTRSSEEDMDIDEKSVEETTISSPLLPESKFKPDPEPISTNEPLQPSTAPIEINQRVYTKSSIYEIFQHKQAIESEVLKDSFCHFIELLGKSPSASSRAAHGDRRSLASSSAKAAPPGYETSPPGYALRRDQRSHQGGRDPTQGRRHGSGRHSPMWSGNFKGPGTSSHSILTPTEGRWVPPSARRLTILEDSPYDAVIRLIHGVLNKLTPDNFTRLTEQVTSSLVEPLSVLTQAYPKLRDAVIANEEPNWSEPEDEARSLLAQIISIFFDKAVDEPHFAPLYACLCRQLAANPNLPNYPTKKHKTADPTPTSMFRMAILMRCRVEFENKVAWSKAAISAPSLDEEAEFQRVKTKRRVLGNIAFIGHLYKYGLLREEIILGLVQSMLDSKAIDEDEIECCIQLLHSTGSRLESSASKDLDIFFERLQSLASDTSPVSLSNRIRFAIMDLTDLRKASWNKELVSLVTQPAKTPLVTASAPALSRPKPPRPAAVPVVRSIASRPGSAKTSPRAVPANKFDLLQEDIDDVVDSSSASMEPPIALPIPDPKTFKEEKSEAEKFTSIIRTAINEDPSKADLALMGANACQLLERHPEVVTLILSEFFDVSEAKQLKLCSFCRRLAPIPTGLRQRLILSIEENFDSWEEDVPRLSSNLGRLVAHLLVDPTGQYQLHDFAALANTLGTERRFVLFAGTMLHYLSLETPLETKVISSIMMQSEDISTFVTAHNIHTP